MKKLINILFLYFFNINVLISQQIESPLVNSFTDYKNLKKNTPLNVEWISLGPVLNCA